MQTWINLFTFHKALLGKEIRIGRAGNAESDREQQKKCSNEVRKAGTEAGERMRSGCVRMEPEGWMRKAADLRCHRNRNVKR